MRYLSTRYTADTSQVASFFFSEILLKGLADDGGLFLPEHYPHISRSELDSWRTLSYAQLAARILGKFITDIDTTVIERLCAQTYTKDTFCHTRAVEEAEQITPIHWLGEEQGAQLGLLCLSYGPTLAFKDIAMQLLGSFFEYALSKNNQTLNILGATSGDTGSAAEYAMCKRKGIRVFMLSPYQRMTAFQTAQMFSLDAPNIFNIAIQGVFDDCQDIVKAVSSDLAFKSDYHIGTVNSINWARLLFQVVYYFRAYLAATDNSQQRVSFAVPSGNFGNVCAGHIARMMGLPIAKLVVATNENDVLDEFFRTGVYRIRGTTDTLATSSPSMDISKASNFERFIADLFQRDGQKVAQLFQQIEQQGYFDISGTQAFQKIAHYGFVSSHSTHTQRLDIVRELAQRYQIVIDPHTANGVQAARQFLQPEIPMLVLETALPAKFAEFTQEALGSVPERPDAYQDLECRPQNFTLLNKNVEQVKQFIREHINQVER
jgi:threonine synthase